MLIMQKWEVVSSLKAKQWENNIVCHNNGTKNKLNFERVI